MNLSNRFKIALGVMTNKGLTESLGSVVKNYNPDEGYNPYRQVTGITYKAIDKIGMAVSGYEPIVKRSNGDAYENHPIKTLAMRPSANMSSTKFHRLWAMNNEIYGETFWYLARGEQTQKVKEVYLLSPPRMEVVQDNGEVVGYILHKENGEQVPFDLTEVYHDMVPNPFNPLRGLSVLEKASVYVNTELTTSNFTLNYMLNNASPSGIVTLPNMNQEAFKQFTMQWRESYEGPRNAGKTAFIRGESASFQAVGATLKDVDQKVTREMAKDDVLMMFDVPKGLLGMSGDKGMGRTEIEALEYVFAKYKTEPLLNTLDEIWFEVAKMGRLAVDGVSRIDHESPIPYDKAYDLEKRKVAVNNWITVNEAREQEGLPALTSPIFDTIVPKIAGLNTATEPKKTKKITFKTAEAPKTEKQLNDEQEAFRQNLVDNNEPYALKLKRAISKIASQQEKEVISRISVATKTYEEWLFNVEEESLKMAAVLAPIIISLMEEQSKDVANFITGEALEITTQIKNTVELEMKQIAGAYNAETIKALEKTISAGQAEGESLAKIKKRVEQEFSNAKGYRAERIARTESLRASNMAAELSYKASGYSTVRWFVNPGACEFCQTFAGQTKTIGTAYSKVGGVITSSEGNQMRIDYRDIDVPPLHPNCACSLVPEA